MADELERKKRKKRKRRGTVKRTKWIDGRKQTVKVRRCRRQRKPQPPGSTHPPAPVVTSPGGRWRSSARPRSTRARA